MVYLLGDDRLDTYSYGFEDLDGDFNKVEAIDLSRDGGLMPMVGSMANCGRPVRGEYFPTRMLRQGPKRYLPDVFLAHGIQTVSDKVKEIIEHFEPGVHQFFPVDIVHKDGSFVGKCHFLVVCNRLDSLHRGLTTMQFNRVLWEPVPGGDNRIVFDKSKIGGKHLWRDKHLISQPLMSDALGETLREGQITGIKLIAYEEA